VPNLRPFPEIHPEIGTVMTIQGPQDPADFLIARGKPLDFIAIIVTGLQVEQPIHFCPFNSDIPIFAIHVILRPQQTGWLLNRQEFAAS
jgi:hypothetical protein